MLQFTEAELQYRIIYAIIVAGKSAVFAEKKTKELFSYSHYSPFDQIKFWSKAPGGILYNLKLAKTGNYNKIEKALRFLINLNIDLATCVPQELEQVPGIGPKTSRFFVLWTRPDARCAALDVHVLRWLLSLGYNVPKVTPSGKKYAEIEQWFLDEADRRGMSPRELDAQVWMAGSNYPTYNPEF